MSAADPQESRGAALHEPGRCTCKCLEPLHVPGVDGRGACSNSRCQCRKYQPKEVE